ncbi:MAG: hypothetical protein ACJAZ4_000464 [Neptuniibacter pectenicola]|jgi:hypothetical protein|tara:strand:+ start:118 stop:246 length:129 start_codon:yes stop_codon:yes gene_type:complete
MAGDYIVRLTAKKEVLIIFTVVLNGVAVLYLMDGSDYFSLCF